jgi:hypothetical protein
MGDAVFREHPWWERPELSPEIRALVACAKTVLEHDSLGILSSALTACPSAEFLCDTAVSHGMLGHLHRLVTSEAALGADPALIRRLNKLQREAALRSLRQTASLLGLLQELEAAGVRAMPIKGPAWAERLYGDIAMRVCADLDVLVPHDQVLAAREVVLANGYSDAAGYNMDIVRWHKEGWGHIEMIPTGSNPFLELHWEVFVSIGCRSLRGEELLKNASTGHLLGREVLAPSSEDAVLIDCVHGAKHEWDTVERLLGLAVRVVATPVEDWAGIFTAARRAGCRRRLVIGVAHACRVFGMTVPAEIRQALVHDRRSQLYLQDLKPALLDKSYQRTNREALVRLLARFATEDSVALSLRHASLRFFTPGPEDWGTIALPAHLGWLYWLLRPGRVTVKWLKLLLRVPGRRRETTR